MEKVPEVFAQHIVEAIEKIENYIRGFDVTMFERDGKTYDAVVRELEIIGEATRNLEEGFKDKFPDVPWSEIVGMRNKLAHDYWEIEVEVVWNAATIEAPLLREKLQKWLGGIDV